MLSQSPLASLAKVFAVAGATNIASAHKPKSTWLFQPASELTSEKTAFFESVERVSGVIKSVADWVIKTWTSAPSLIKRRVKKAALYAAILPVTPRRIFLLFKAQSSKIQSSEFKVWVFKVQGSEFLWTPNPEHQTFTVGRRDLFYCKKSANRRPCTL